VRDGRIAAVGPAARVRVPEGARTIDGGGGWLVPGFADMHAHLYSDGGVPDTAGPAELGVMLAHGITAVRLMIGTPEQLALRDGVVRGAVTGPQLWVASPHFTNEASDNARVVTTPEQARAAVREVQAAGYDFVKVTFGITGALYDALVDEARRRRIRVIGHVEPAVGVRRAVAAGQQMEHLDAFLEDALADSAPSRESLTQFGVYKPANWASLDHLDDAKLDALVRDVVRGGAWIVPTLEIFNRAFSEPLTDSALFALPDWRMIPAAIRGPYLTSRTRYWSHPVSRERRVRYAALRRDIVRRLAASGGAGRIMAGSDSPDLLMAYGYAYHRELAQLVQAGLTPWQALAAGTVNPARFLGAEREWGTIAPGRRADLVLLAANPLDDIANTARVAGVAMGGRWHERAELDAMIDAGRRAIGGEAPAPAALDSLLQAADRRAILDVVNGMTTAMRRRDTATLRALFVPGAKLLGMRQRRGADAPHVQALTADDFAAFVARDSSRGAWVERLWEPKVEVRRPLATVWAPYDFHFDTTFSHCGVDAFQLLRTAEGWRIASLADTYETAGCPERTPPAR
jgi:imidazolonepropionase-like amidohydrolase